MSAQIHTQDRLLQVIVAPQITEKATRIADKNQQIAFKVRTDATKPEIKAAIELVFKVEVDSVTVINVAGKAKRVGRTMGRRQDWKKAYVSLKPGGLLAVEINEKFGEIVSKLFREEGFREVQVIRDLAGKHRIVSGYRGQ